MNHSQYAGGDEPTILNFIEQLFSLAQSAANLNSELADNTEGSLAQLCQLGIIKYEEKQNPSGATASSVGGAIGNADPGLARPHTLGIRLEKLAALLQRNLDETHTINQAAQFLRLNLSRQTDLPPNGDSQAQTNNRHN